MRRPAAAIVLALAAGSVVVAAPGVPWGGRAAAGPPPRSTAAPIAASAAAVTADQVAGLVLPRPQHVETRGVTITIGADWRLVVDASDPAFAFGARWYNEKIAATAPLTLTVADGRTDRAAPRRIVVGDPARHPFVREALLRHGRFLPRELGAEGYVLDAQGGERPEIVIAAHAPAGAFYGMVTLVQLVRPDGSLPAVFILDHPDHTVRGSYEPGSAVFGFQSGANVFTDRQRQFIDWLAAHKMNYLFLVDNGDFFAEASTWVPAYRELFAYARERFVEPVPRICSISTVAPFPFPLYEGWYVRGEPFTFGADDVAAADRPFVDLAANGDFEIDADADGRPDGWSTASVTGATWSIDTTTAASGGRSMRLDIPSSAAASSSAVLSLRLTDVAPDSRYCVWSRARAEAIADVQPQLTIYSVGADRQVFALQSDVTWSTSGWIDFGACVRTPPDPIALTVYARIQSPGSGTFWIDDVRVHRVDGALRNVLRAEDTDIVVTDAAGAVTYTLGTDYAIEDGRTGMKLLPSFEPFRVRRLPGGRIRPGEAVRLSYDAYLFTRLTQYWQSAPCVACEALYRDYYEPAIDRVVSELHPRVLNIDADEIRGFYRDSRMQRRFASNAEAIAYWADRIQAYLASRDPDARLWIWDDMVSPYHNGGVADYQVHYGGLPGRMAESTERDLIDRSILMDVWWYSDEWLAQMWHSVDYFTRKGFDVLGSPWDDPENVVSWSEILVGRAGALGGVATNWGTPFEPGHAAFADHFWNTRRRLVWFESFEDDADRDLTPDGWTADGPVEHSLDGTRTRGRRYAGFPNGALGLVTGTIEVAGPAVPVRPGTTYTAGAFLRREPWAAPRPTLRLTWRDAGGRVVGRHDAPLADVGTAYREWNTVATSPPGAASVTVGVQGPAGGLWLDDLRLREDTAAAGAGGTALFVPFAARR